MLGSTHKAPRRFTFTVLGILGAVVVGFASLNTWINPLWVTPAPWSTDKYADWKPVYRHQRTAKAGMLKAEEWNTAFFGSSRIDIALDPALPEWGERKAINLATSAGNIQESSGILHYAIEHAPLDLCIVGVDFGDLTNPSSNLHLTGYMESPFFEQSNSLERKLRYLAGISSFESSIGTLSNYANKEQPQYTRQGHRVRHIDPEPTEVIIRRDSISFAIKSIRRGKRDRIALSPMKVDCLQRVLDDTKAAKAKLVIALPPYHATYLGVFHHLGDSDPNFSTDRELLTRMVAESNNQHPEAPAAIIWDFNDFHPLNCEPLPEGDELFMKWWGDGTHANRKLGNIMLARIMGWPINGPGKDYGVILAEENLKERYQSLDEGYTRFKNESPKLWRWMINAVKSYQN